MTPIVIISTELPPIVGGIGSFALSLGRALQTLGHRVRIVASAAAHGEEPIRDVPVTRTPAILNLKLLKILPLIVVATLQCMQRPRAVLLAMSWKHEGVVAFLVSWIVGTSYLLVAHGSELLQNRQNRLRAKVMRRIFRDARFVISNSRFTHQQVLALGIGADRAGVVNPAIEVPADSIAPDGSVDGKFCLEGKRVLFTAARLAPRKGHALVIEAIHKIKDQYPNLVYVMTGDSGCRAELERLVERLGISSQIRMVGFVSFADLRSLYRRMDIYVSPSLEVDGDVEGFGISFIEAGALGKPVIAGRSGGVGDAVIDGETGILVDPGDSAALRNAICLLLDNDELRHRLGQAARNRIARECTHASQTNALSALSVRGVFEV